MKLLALLLLCVACTHGFAIVPAHATDRNAKMVRALLPFASEVAWQRSGYWRPEDPVASWPWYIVVAADGTACVLNPPVVYLPNVSDYWDCATPWRMSRP